MTNSEKKQELIETWTNLKGKLSKLVYLGHNKELIKEEVEIYLNQSSSFLSGHDKLLRFSIFNMAGKDDYLMDI